MNHFDNLPDELLMLVMMNLGPGTYFNFAQCSKRMSRVANDFHVIRQRERSRKKLSSCRGHVEQGPVYVGFWYNQKRFAVYIVPFMRECVSCYHKRCENSEYWIGNRPINTKEFWWVAAERTAMYHNRDWHQDCIDPKIVSERGDKSYLVDLFELDEYK